MRILLSALAGILAGCSAPATVAIDVNRPALLEAAPVELRAAIAAADRHILVVRHARKIAPDCNAMDCQLSERGEAMVARLAELIGAPPVDFAYSSAACRTYLTAMAGGTDVVMHQAADGLETGCQPGDVVTRSRSDAFDEAAASTARWGLVAEHSNTSCLWLTRFAGDAGEEAAGCQNGRLPDGAYGDIYWIYRVAGEWQVAVLPAAFTPVAPAAPAD